MVLIFEPKHPLPEDPNDPSSCRTVPEPPPGVNLRKIADAVPRQPIDAIEYREFLAPLVGEGGEDYNAPIVTIVRRILLLALQQGARELRFDIRVDECLDVRMLLAGGWMALPALNCTGSALSRLLVLGNLEKGEEARSRPQRGRTTFYGVELTFQTEPLWSFHENIAVFVGPRDGAREPKGR